MDSRSLAENVLISPSSKNVDRLCIYTKNASPNMASWLLLNLIKKKRSSFKVDLIIDTATTGGIYTDYHESFRELHSIVPNFVCSYTFESASSNNNYYVWLKGDTPVIAFAGDTVFTQSSFFEQDSGKLALCGAAAVYEKYQEVVGKSIYSHHSEVEESVRIFQASTSGNPTAGEEVVLSLVTEKTGEPGTRSGLNWGQRKKRNPNQAYIPLPRSIAKSGFFPVEPIGSPPHFTVVTDDNHQLILRIEQQNQKAITTPLSNAQLGEYFRNRLGLANGAYVKREHLERYGRTDVKFVKIDCEHYYLDFSI